MSEVIGKIIEIEGLYLVKSPDGSIREVTANSVLYKGDTLLSQGGTSLKVVLNNGDEMTFDENAYITFDDTVIGDESYGHNDTAFDIEAAQEVASDVNSDNIDELQQAILDGKV